MDKYRNLGVGMLEVLVALVLVSVGLLGMASLQLNGMKVAKGSFSRSQAVLFVENMVTRMRSNPTGVTAGLYNNRSSVGISCNAKPDPYCSAYPGSPSITPTCSTPANVATNDMFAIACGDWTGSGSANGMSDQLLNSIITIDCDDATCDPTSTYTIKLTWSEVEIINGVDSEQNKQVTVKVLP